MSGIGISFNQPIWANLLSAAKAGVLGNAQTTVSALSADAVGLIGQEAQDFDTAITKFSEDIQAGMAPADALTKEWGAYATQAKSDAWNGAMKALTDGLSFIDGVLKTIEAAI